MVPIDTKLPAILAAAVLTLTVLLPGPAGAAAQVCGYPPTGPAPMKAPQQDVIVGPYPTTVKEQRVDHCSGPDFVFNTLAPCPVPLMTVSQPGEWCGPVTTSPTSPTTGGMWICTVYENLGVNLTGIVAGWDLASAPPGGGAPPWGAMPSSIPGSPGFVGPPDGNIDQWDHFAGGTLGGMAWTNVPDPGSLPLLESYSTIVYPPATMPYGFGQIQVFPLVGPNLLPIPLPVGGPIGVGCI